MTSSSASGAEIAIYIVFVAVLVAAPAIIFFIGMKMAKKDREAGKKKTLSDSPGYSEIGHASGSGEVIPPIESHGTSMGEGAWKSRPEDYECKTPSDSGSGGVGTKEGTTGIAGSSGRVKPPIKPIHTDDAALTKKKDKDLPYVSILSFDPRFKGKACPNCGAEGTRSSDVGTPCVVCGY